MREKQGRERKGETQGAVAPLAPAHSAPPLGALGLAAGQVAAPGGAGHRRGRGAGHSPGEEKEEEGAVAPSTEKGGLCPPPAEEKKRGGFWVWRWRNFVVVEEMVIVVVF